MVWDRGPLSVFTMWITCFLNIICWKGYPFSIAYFWCLCRSLVNYMDRWRRRQWHPTPVLLPGKSHGRRSLVGCSPWGCYGHDWVTSFSLSCIKEGNGNPLQCSCLENPRDRGAWWAAVYGVAQSRTRLKWVSSSKAFTIHWVVFYSFGLFIIVII